MNAFIDYLVEEIQTFLEKHFIVVVKSSVIKSALTVMSDQQMNRLLEDHEMTIFEVIEAGGAIDQLTPNDLVKNINRFFDRIFRLVPGRYKATIPEINNATEEYIKTELFKVFGKYGMYYINEVEEITKMLRNLEIPELRFQVNSSKTECKFGKIVPDDDYSWRYKYCRILKTDGVQNPRNLFGVLRPIINKIFELNMKIVATNAVQLHIDYYDYNTFCRTYEIADDVERTEGEFKFVYRYIPSCIDPMFLVRYVIRTKYIPNYRN